VLHVRDNGVGIRRQQIPGRLRHSSESLGLIGMSERANALGGDVHIRSTVGRGTKVLLTLPLEPTS
jgi:signal transduction histidine kinase